MKIRSIKVNYALNLLRVVSGILFGIITMPYINKVLGAESLGKVEYVNSIITYFLLLSSLGIPMYGLREVAKIRNDSFKRTKLVTELLTILGITTLISYLVIFGVILNLPYFFSYKELIIILSTTILFTNFGAEWFYQGIEDQMFITIRYLVVRGLSFVLLFVLVKNPDDYLWYASIVVLSTAGANVFNVLYLKKYLDFKGISFKNLDLKQHLKPAMTIFVGSISVSIYLQLDITILGTAKGDEAVGYYVMANKLIRFVIAMVTTIGAVMLPRLAHLLASDKRAFYNLVETALNYIMIFSIPATFGFLVLAKDFTLLMGGDGFEESILTTQILSPIVTIVGLAYFLGFLILFPLGKERIYTVSTIIAAVLSIILNLIFVNRYGHNATASIAVFSEVIGVVFMIILGKSMLRKINFFNRSILIYIIASIAISILLFLLTSLLPDHTLVLKVAVEISAAVVFFMLILYLSKEKVFFEVINMFKAKLKR
ncbi:flippase [Chryseobacterium sp. JJR-5R]|uniref:flippase n=1 Tax=Chryseobacterium sp. JJR-5R TaxID=3093923 RepID=UPI002A750A02|nr:flippase [Chryseobacterium sp. JJR-5R]WPO82017.1 flippase [Chryseobacterium sp. JJR-5R]